MALVNAAEEQLPMQQVSVGEQDTPVARHTGAVVVVVVVVVVVAVVVVISGVCWY